MAKGPLSAPKHTSGILKPRPILGYMAMMGNTVLIPVMAVAIKFLTAADFSTIQMLSWRSALVLIVLLPFLFFSRFRKALFTADLKAHVIHATLSIVSMSCFYFALRTLPIVTVTSINFTTPTIAVILASLLYREHISPISWFALGIGFVGALFILKPDLGGISFDMVVVMLGSFLAACTNLAVSRMPAKSSNFAVIFYLPFQIALEVAPFVLDLFVTPTCPTHLCIYSTSIVNKTSELFIRYICPTSFVA